MGFLGNDLKYVQINAITTYPVSKPKEITEPNYDKTEKMKDDFNNESAKGMDKCIQTAEGIWAWMQSEDAFFKNAIQGMLLALFFCFLVLLIATMNIVIATYATICVGCIILCVMGVMEMAGWAFGVIESLSCVILIGFSVDYIVHLANHYVETPFSDRYNRVRESLKQIGISIFGGAATTLGASIFMFLCTLLFFTKFALLISVTIIYSIYFSIIVFAAVCHLFGPQKNFGNLKPYVKRCWNSIREKCCGIKSPEPISSEKKSEVKISDLPNQGSPGKEESKIDYSNMTGHHNTTSQNLKGDQRNGNNFRIKEQEVIAIH